MKAVLLLVAYLANQAAPVPDPPMIVPNPPAVVVTVKAKAKTALPPIEFDLSALQAPVVKAVREVPANRPFPAALTTEATTVLSAVEPSLLSPVAAQHLVPTFTVVPAAIGGGTMTSNFQHCPT